MDLTMPMPRVNGEMLRDFIGKRVLLVCKVNGARPGEIDGIAADGKHVRVMCRGSLEQTSGYVEFEGVADSPDSLVENEHVILGDNFEMTNYNELCKLAAREHRDAFLP